MTGEKVAQRAGSLNEMGKSEPRSTSRYEREGEAVKSRPEKDSNEAVRL